MEIILAFILGMISCSTGYYVYSAFKLKKQFKGLKLNNNKLGEHFNHSIANINNQLSTIKNNNSNSNNTKEFETLQERVEQQFKVIAKVVHKIEEIETKMETNIIHIRKELEMYGT